MHRAVAREGEGFQLDAHVLPRLHEADVLVLQGDLGADLGAVGHDDHEGLGFGDDAAFRVGGQLLHGAGHGGLEGGELFALGGLGPFLAVLLALQVSLGLAVA